MSSVTLDPVEWSEKQFGGCDFGDVRRVRRAVKVASQIAANTDASTPNQTESWRDCKRVYELFDNEHVTFQKLTGMMSLQALRLVQLKALARTQPETPATKVVSKRWVQILGRLRKKPNALDWSVRCFYRELAGLGGFLGRKGDGEPGWQTTWRGFKKLIQALRGYEIRQRCREP